MLRNPLILALDVDERDRAQHLISLLSSKVGAIKVGPRLTNAFGPEFVRKISDNCPVFVDHKYYDIPSTMEAAVRSAFDMGASLVTVHASAGSEALKKLSLLEKQLNKDRPFQILAVTVLTSFTAQTLPNFVQEIPLKNQVMELARLAIDCGINGIVSSPEEVKVLRENFPMAALVTPGIRLKDSAADDQKRTATASEAMKDGSNYLVIGRPILEAKDPVQVVDQFLREIQTV